MNASFAGLGIELPGATACAGAATVGPPSASMTQSWDGLCDRAAPNVFMHPAVLEAAQQLLHRRVHVLRSWFEDAQPARLVGLWGLQQRALTPLGPSMLVSPPFEHAFVGNPVVDPSCMHLAVPGLLDAIERDPTLPKVLLLRCLDAEAPTYAPLLAQLARRGRVDVIAQRDRPYIARDLLPRPATSTRRKLRQKWNRLCGAGAVEFVERRSPAAVRMAFETYLALEQASWKGSRGTAFLSSPQQARFARAFIDALADERSASVALLLLDGEPIAAQVLLYRGATAYTWKTAFDARYGQYSPGMLLADRITEHLFAGGVVHAIESCSPDGGFLGQLWHGRRRTVDLVASVAGASAVDHALVTFARRSHARLRAMRDALKGFWRAFVRGDPPPGGGRP